MVYLLIGFAFAVSSYIVIIRAAYKLTKNMDEGFPYIFFVSWIISATITWPIMLISLCATSPKEIAKLMDEQI